MFLDANGNPCEEKDLSPTGKVRRSRSTRKGNSGGVSVQEEFTDRTGRAVTKHTVYDSNGRIIHCPHFRPGGFK